MYSIFEHNFKIREGDEQRTVSAVLVNFALRETACGPISFSNFLTRLGTGYISQRSGFCDGVYRVQKCNFQSGGGRACDEMC